MSKSVRDVIVVGCSICALFFGSGNIVLPLMIGSSYYDSWWLGYIGFTIGAVLLPFIGLVAISLRNGNADDFFKGFFVKLLQLFCGKSEKCNRSIDSVSGKISFFIRFIILAIIGPFGIVPRCLTVAEGSFHAVGNIPDYVFHCFMVLLLWAIVCNKDKVMSAISKILTPIKLTMLIGVVGLCLICMPETRDVGPGVVSPIYSGLLIGYQTLDLIGAIFFGTIIIDYVKKNEHINTKREIFTFSLKAGFIGAIILSILYLGFTVMALGYNAGIAELKPEEMFVGIVNIAFGKAALIVGLTVIVSCLTTAVALMSVWVNFISEFLNTYRRVDYKLILFVSLLVTYLFALLGLGNILAILEPILIFMYPIVIVITLFNLISDIRNFNKDIL